MARQKWLNLVLAGVAVSIITGIGTVRVRAQQPRTPSDTVREFYKAMRAKKFREAWALTIYKPAIDGLTTEEMEDLRPDFEERASKVPDQVEIMSEQINGSTATVFVKVPSPDGSGQITSEPVALINSPSGWIIGDGASQAIVKKAGRRFFLDAMIDGRQSDMEDLLKRLIAVEVAYSQQHKGEFGDLAALLGAGLMSHDVADPAATGYNFHITVGKDRNTYVAGAEPARYGHTAKLSFWMDQSGAIKSADNGGKPLSPSR
jgi:hypothetical protein